MRAAQKQALESESELLYVWISVPRSGVDMSGTLKPQEECVNEVVVAVG